MPVWQKYYEKHQSRNIEILSVAVDAQGPDKPRIFAEKAGAQFTTVVDDENLLGHLYGFKAVPNGFLIDESGVVQYKKLGGFDVRREETAQLVEQWATEKGLRDVSVVADDDLGEEHSQAISHFRIGLEHYRQGKTREAMTEWRKGVELEPDNYIIRKQIWAVENPEKFYAGNVDFDWQKVQLAQGR